MFSSLCVSIMHRCSYFCGCVCVLRSEDNLEHCFFSGIIYLMFYWNRISHWTYSLPTRVGWVVSSINLYVSASPELGLEEHSIILFCGLYGFWGVISGHRAYTGSSLRTKNISIVLLPFLTKEFLNCYMTPLMYLRTKLLVLDICHHCLRSQVEDWHYGSWWSWLGVLK